MKLRNKKTGEIIVFDSYHRDNLADSCGELLLETRMGKDYSYHSLAELNEDWEDYKPKEPLIKDEKIRKLVLAWAKLTQTTKILTVKRRTSIGAKFTEFFSQEKCISLEFLGRFDELEDGKEYDIAELCGSEE